jgi:hypothetical protein
MYSDDKIMAAYAASFCDLLAVPLLEMRALVKALNDKGVLTFADYKSAKESIPAEAYADAASELQRNLQARIMERLRSMGEGPVH